MKLFLQLCIAVAVLFSFTANAQQDYPRPITVSWDNADSYVDGTLIEAGDLEHARIEIFRHNDTVAAFTATVPVTGEGLHQLETFTEAIPQPGTYRIEGYSIVVGGIESDPSIPAYEKYVGKPRSITNVTVE